MTNDEFFELLKKIEKEINGSTMQHIKAKLITLDGIEHELEIPTPNGIPNQIARETPQGLKRIYERDMFRDYEYREVHQSTSGKKSTVKILSSLARDLKAAGYKDFVTLHVHPKAFKAMFKEMSGHVPDETITYFQVQADVPVYVRFAPEKQGPTTVLAPDLKKLPLKELIELKLAQEKT